MSQQAKKLPLFEKYPLLGQNLPFVSLGLYPTPVQELEGISPSNRVYIKRDDMSGEEYGGNKIRKLEFVLGEALQMGAKEVLTFGCDGSNHALATGIYAKKLGMQSTSILRTQYNAKYVRKNLLKNLYYGIKLIHCETLDEMNAEAEKLQKKSLAETGLAVYEIPVGGSSPLGTVGFVNAAFELKQQIDAGLLPEPDYIYAAAGTLGTVAGLTVGISILGLKTKVIAVKVNGENRINVPAMVSLMNDTAALLNKADPSFPAREYTADDVTIDTEYFGEDYALFTKEGANAVRFMSDKYSIDLEGTYTGKTCAAVLDAARGSGKNKVFLFWNTLNSRDPNDAAGHNDYHELPEAFRFYFETGVQELDR